MQEVGRGLRLPVDEYGNRISDEQFYLTYLFDYSEKDFADRLIGEINQDSKLARANIKTMLRKVAVDRGIDENILYAQLLINKYIDVDGNINYENRDKFIAEYPEFNVGLEQNKIISKDKKNQGMVYIRKDKFAKIKELWRTINKKYYLSLDKIPNEELYKASLDILNKEIRDDVIATTIEKRTSVKNGGIVLKEATSGYYVLDESIPYGEFLKQVQVATGLPVVMHKALCDYNRTKTLDKAFFN